MSAGPFLLHCAQASSSTQRKMSGSLTTPLGAGTSARWLSCAEGAAGPAAAAWAGRRPTGGPFATTCMTFAAILTHVVK